MADPRQHPLLSASPLLALIAIGRHKASPLHVLAQISDPLSVLMVTVKADSRMLLPGVGETSYLELTSAQALVCQIELAQRVVHVGVHPRIIQYNVWPEARQH